MASPFNEWGLEQANEAIADAIKDQVGSEAAFDANAAFVEEHDHWQGGKTWVGPNGGSDSAVQKAVLAAVERQFTPRDAIGEILDRVANALLKREPDVSFVPLQPVPDPEIPPDADQQTRDRLRADAEQRRAAQQAAADEMRRNISAWWDRKGLWELARVVVKRGRWAGRGGLRTWIAPGNLVAAKADAEGAAVSALRLPAGLDFLDALMRVELSAPRPDALRVHTDQETQQKVGIFTFHDDEDDADKAELWFVDGEDTVLRVAADGESAEPGEFRVQLGKRLPIVEMEADVLITEPVRRQQNRLNFHESVLVRVGEVAGFPERYTINAEPGGIWLETPPAGTPPLATQVHGGKTFYLHPAPRTLGAAITTDLVGIITKSGSDEQRATPGVVFKDPTDPEYAIKAAQHAYHSLLRECKQGHLTNTTTGEASGVAYEQARADYEADLEGVRGPLEAMLREIIDVAIAWAEAMTKRQEGGSFLDRYRTVVALKVNAGPITPDQQRAGNENVKAGTLSRASAMAAAGVEDVDAELQKIMQDPAALLELRTGQSQAITTLVAEGMSWERAARVIGIDDPELLREFREADADAEEAAAQARSERAEVNGGQDGSIEDILRGTRAQPGAPARAGAEAA